MGVASPGHRYHKRHGVQPAVLNSPRPLARASRIVQTPSLDDLKSLELHARTLNALFTQHATELVVPERIYYINNIQHRLRSSGSTSLKRGIIPAVFDHLMCLCSWMAFVGHSMAIR